MKTQTGYTFAEVLVTMGLAAILAMVALPSVKHIILNNKITTKTNDFIRAQSFARSEAIRLGGNAIVEVAAIDGKWSKGWQVTCQGSGCDESILAIKQFYKDEQTENDNIVVKPYGTSIIVSSIRYNSRGQQLGGMVKFLVCTQLLPPSQVAWRQVTLRKSGSVSVERKEQDEGGECSTQL
jgi:Tfp pilus assembly protein FimT